MPLRFFFFFSLSFSLSFFFSFPFLRISILFVFLLQMKMWRPTSGNRPSTFAYTWMYLDGDKNTSKGGLVGEMFHTRSFANDLLIAYRNSALYLLIQKMHFTKTLIHLHIRVSITTRIVDNFYIFPQEVVVFLFTIFSTTFYSNSVPVLYVKIIFEKKKKKLLTTFLIG